MPDHRVREVDRLHPEERVEHSVRPSSLTKRASGRTRRICCSKLSHCSCSKSSKIAKPPFEQVLAEA